MKLKHLKIITLAVGCMSWLGCGRETSLRLPRVERNPRLHNEPTYSPISFDELRKDYDCYYLPTDVTPGKHYWLEATEDGRTFLWKPKAP